MASLLPRGSGRRQAAVLLLALASCPLAAWLIGEHPAGAVARARALLDAQTALGLDPEPALNAWARGHETLWAALNALYAGAHVPATGWALIWTWYLRRDRFPALRDSFLRLQALLVVCWVALPTAPPSAVPGGGVEDGLGVASGVSSLLQSPFAAVPSGHVAFAVLAGATFARLGDQAWLRWFGRAYPFAVVALVLLTGNHLWLDAVAGAAAAWFAGGPSARLAALARQLLSDLRPGEVAGRGAAPQRVHAHPHPRPRARWRAPRHDPRRPALGGERGDVG